MTQTIYIKTVTIQGDLILAPMEGYSDHPFRTIAREMGSALSCTEFVSATDVLNGHPYLLAKRLAYTESERPVVFQIYDSESERIIAAAIELRKLNPDIIDINMGCSVRDISRRGAGAGLLRSPEKIAHIFHELSTQLDIPVTGKIRLGWDEENQNYIEIAHIIEDNGGAMLSVHARTRQQGFNGSANWDAITKIKQSVRIPVIGNGDVRSIQDIEMIKQTTGCDAVMIGRAAIGNPWLFSRIDRSQLSMAEIRQVVFEHLNRITAFYGNQRGMIKFRKHLLEYVRPLNIINREERTLLMTRTDPDELRRLLDSIVFQR